MEWNSLRFVSMGDIKVQKSVSSIFPLQIVLILRSTHYSIIHTMLTQHNAFTFQTGILKQTWSHIYPIPPSNGLVTIQLQQAEWTLAVVIMNKINLSFIIRHAHIPWEVSIGFNAPKPPQSNKIINRNGCRSFLWKKIAEVVTRAMNQIHFLPQYLSLRKGKFKAYQYTPCPKDLSTVINQ